MLPRTFLLLFTLVLGGCAEWREALQGYFNPEQWNQEPSPTRPVPTVQERGLLDSRFHMRVLRMEAVSPPAGTEDEEGTPSDELAIHVLNIKAGSCQIVRCPNSHRVIVMDCGSRGASGDDLVGEQIAGYAQAHALFSHAETEILVAVSHPDQDHTNKIPVILQNHPVQSIWLGGEYKEYTGPISGFLEQADHAGVLIHHGWYKISIIEGTQLTIYNAEPPIPIS